MPEEEVLAEWHRLLAAFKTIPRHQRGAAIEVIEAMVRLGPNAIEILRSQAAGLIRGLPYGDWNEGRDMVAEAIAEARDGANYTRREWLRMQKVIRAHALFTEAHNELLSVEEK
jgi:hypothetical protein